MTGDERFPLECPVCEAVEPCRRIVNVVKCTTCGFIIQDFRPGGAGVKQPEDFEDDDG